MLISNDFWHKIKHFEPYNVLLSIATNIPVLLMTASVLQAHIITRLCPNGGVSPLRVECTCDPPSRPPAEPRG